MPNRSTSALIKGLLGAKQSLLGSMGLSFAASIWATLLALVTVPLMVNGLGLAEYGVYSVCFYLVSLGSYLDLGLGWSVAKFIAEADTARDPSRVGAILAASAGYQLAISLSFAIVVVIAAPWISQAILSMPDNAMRETAVVLRITSISFVASSLAGVMIGGLRGLRRFAMATSVASSSSTISVVGAAAAAHFGLGVVATAVAQLIGVLIGLVASCVVCRHFLRHAQDRNMIRRELRAMLSFSLWSYITRLFQMLALSADKIVLTRWAGPAALAFYAVPFNLSQRVNFLAGPAVTSIFPMAAVGRSEPEAFIRQYLSASRLVHAVTAAVAVSLIAWGPTFLGAWIGPEMQSNGQFFLCAFAVGFWIVSVGSFDGGCIEGWSRPRLTCAISALAVALALVTLGVAWTALGAPKALALSVAMYFSIAGIGQAVAWYLLSRYPLRPQLRRVLLPITEMAILGGLAAFALRGIVHGRVAIIVTLFVMIGALAGYGIFRAFSSAELRALAGRVRSIGKKS
jgi:O-antigen/teichoic acid export membrane protein